MSADRSSYTYYVSYSFTGRGGRGVGGIEIHTEEPIDNIDAINGIAKLIRDQNGYQCAVITNFQLLTGPTQRENR